MSDAAGHERVELVANVFERTYRSALAPGSFARIEADHRRRFDRKVALINNVADRDDAARRAQRLASAGEIDAFHFVADRLESTLETVGLTRSELEPLIHYSDFALTALTLPGCPWLLYWDPEARLSAPVDWVGPAIALMRSDRRIIAANPSWELPGPDGGRPAVEREATEASEGFAIGPGFSDQVFLVRRAELSAPIYGQRCLSRLLYPGAHKAHVFEARVQAHMRHHDRMRATALDATYLISGPGGTSTYPPDGVRETLRYLRNGLLVRALRASPWRPRCARNTWL